MGFHEGVEVVDVESEVENDDEDEDDDGNGEKPLQRFAFAKNPTQQDRKKRFDIRFVDIIVIAILYFNLPVFCIGLYIVNCRLSLSKSIMITVDGANEVMSCEG